MLGSDAEAGGEADDRNVSWSYAYGTFLIIGILISERPWQWERRGTPSVCMALMRSSTRLYEFKRCVITNEPALICECLLSHSFTVTFALND